MNQQKKKIKVKEICPNCYKVLGHLFKLRLKKLKLIKKEIDDAYSLPTKKKKKTGSMFKRKKKETK